MYPQAVTEMQKAVRYSGGSLIAKAYLGLVYGESGDQNKAQEIMNELIETSKDGYVPALAFVLVYIGLGENDNAINWLLKAYNERSSELIFVNVAPEYDPLRSDPRFFELLLKMNFE
jgi:tetratricopeptide (TPR) repeat protein